MIVSQFLVHSPGRRLTSPCLLRLRRPQACHMASSLRPCWALGLYRLLLQSPCLGFTWPVSPELPFSLSALGLSAQPWSWLVPLAPFSSFSTAVHSGRLRGLAWLLGLGSGLGTGSLQAGWGLSWAHLTLLGLTPCLLPFRGFPPARPQAPRQLCLQPRACACLAPPELGLPGGVLDPDHPGKAGHRVESPCWPFSGMIPGGSPSPLSMVGGDFSFLPMVGLALSWSLQHMVLRSPKSKGRGQG